MERRGAGWNDERRFSQKKLCFTATDQALLLRVLGELADRPDCYYVKYSIEPRRRPGRRLDVSLFGQAE
jgi:hypothetical protein